MSIKDSADYQFLREEAQQIPAVSTHDHIRRESEKIAQPTDLFELLFSGLVWVDLVSAGLPKYPIDGIMGVEEHPRPLDYEKLWAEKSPYLDHVRESATYATLMRGIRELFDFDEELDDSNWRALNDKIIAAQEPGWYYEVLHNRDNMEASLLDRPWT